MTDSIPLLFGRRREQGWSLPSCPLSGRSVRLVHSGAGTWVLGACAWQGNSSDWTHGLSRLIPAVITDPNFEVTSGAV